MSFCLLARARRATELFRVLVVDQVQAVAGQAPHSGVVVSSEVEVKQQPAAAHASARSGDEKDAQSSLLRIRHFSGCQQHVSRSAVNSKRVHPEAAVCATTPECRRPSPHWPTLDALL